MEHRLERIYRRRLRRYKAYLASLTVTLLFLLLFSLNLGFSHIPPADIMRILVKRIPIISGFLRLSDVPAVEEIIIIQIRLPRVLGGALVGAALATAGAAYQSIFRNPMADPYVIGASAGAAVGAASAIVLGVGYVIFGVNSIPIFAFLGSIVTVLIVYNISRVGSRVPVTTLLLSGISVSIFLSAIVTLMKVVAGDRLHALIFWLMGGLSYIEWRDIIGVAPLIFAGITVIYLLARDMNIIVLGDEEAQHLGVEVEKVKMILLISGALITASAVSISGLIGFIGLIIPHLTRIIIGSDHRVLVPSSSILGASFLILCDAVARIIASPAELPVGVITALSGGPFFLYLLHKRRGRYAL